MVLAGACDAHAPSLILLLLPLRALQPFLVDGSATISTCQAEENHARARSWVTAQARPVVLLDLATGGTYLVIEEHNFVFWRCARPINAWERIAFQAATCW